MKRKNKIAIGCLSVVVILILVCIILYGVIVHSMKRQVRQVDNYIFAFTEEDAQRWIARTEAILADPAAENFDDLPADMARPLVYYGDGSVYYHFCLGLVCGANLTVNRLPEGGHEIIATPFEGRRDIRIYPKEDVGLNHEPHEPHEQE